jgi:hypothetical protein
MNLDLIDELQLLVSPLILGVELRCSKRWRSGNLWNSCEPSRWNQARSAWFIVRNPKCDENWS